MTDKNKVVCFLLTATLAAIGSIIIGLVFFHGSVIDVNGIGFQFVSFGIMGGLVFSSFRFLRKLEATVVVVLLLILSEIVSRPASPTFVWQNVLYYVCLCVALFVFAHFFYDRLISPARPLLLGSLFALAYMIVAFIFYMVFRANLAGPGFNLTEIIYYDLAQGFLVGIGLGAGIEAAAKVTAPTNSKK